MNIDELKMILETINATTGLAKDMGTTWIWLHYGMQVLQGAFVLATVWLIGYSIFRIIRSCTDEHDTRFMRQCRDRLGIGTTGYMLPEEYALTTGMILSLIDKHNKEKK